MASPKIVVFALYDATTLAPLSGLTPTFSTYKDDTGSTITSPAITELGGGLYKFVPDLTVANQGIAYIVDGGASASPRYLSSYIRPEDFVESLTAPLSTKLGTPLGASVSADIVTLQASVNGVGGLVWDAARSGHTTVGSYGDLMRLLFLVFTGRIRIDGALGTYTVYAENGTTVFQSQVLHKNGIGPAGLDADERLAATRP